MTMDPTPLPFRIEGHGTIVLIYPMTAAARTWLKETAPEDATWWGIQRARVVEPRYVEGVLQAWRADHTEED